MTNKVTEKRKMIHEKERETEQKMRRTCNVKHGTWKQNNAKERETRDKKRERKRHEKGKED